MNAQPRCYYLSPMLLALHGVVVVLLLTGNELRAVIEALALDPELVRSQPWRLIAWPLALSDNRIFWPTIYKVFAYLVFGLAVERYWGSFRFACFLGVTVIGAAASAMLLGLRLFANGLPEMMIFCLFGMLFPESQVLLFFALPIQARLFALLATGVYLANALLAGLFGLPVLAGFGCGAAYYFLVRRGRGWVRATARTIESAAMPRPEQLAARLSTDQLTRQARLIVARRLNADEMPESEAMLLRELAQRADPAKELCPAVWDPANTDGVCPVCKELGVCLRRFVEQRREIPAPKGG